MVMDRDFTSYRVPIPEIKFNNGSDPQFIDTSRVNNMILNGNRADSAQLSSRINFDAQIPSSEVDSPEDCDFSDEVLKYISDMLMEDNVEDKACMFQESAALLAAEKSFYDVLGDQNPVSVNYQYFENSGDICPDWNSDHNFGRNYGIVNAVSHSTSHSYYSSSSSSGTITDGPMDSPVSTLRVPDIFGDSQSAMQFKKGVEEASRFLPNSTNFIVNVTSSESLVNVEKKSNNERGKKNMYNEGMALEEERSNKQSATYTESTVSSDMFDKVLLCSGGKNESELRKALQEVTKTTSQNGQSNNGKTRGKKQKGRKNDVVDMRTLLTHCAQAVATDERGTANDLLKKIRQHASQTGDGMQRLAHYFAGGLEARMAGSGTQIYTSLINMPTSAADILKAYHIYLATCPFRKISNFFANKTIMKVSEKATSLHIIDFGIMYGFQWPCFLQRLSSRPGGPPRLRITGIDLPCPGFRPSERVEETGRRLANYAETFKVPFEFVAIARKWETIKLEELKIEKDEVLVVNCLYRFRNLLDETVIVNSPRNIVLNLVRKLNPAVFVLGVVNGGYNAPFFLTRFREALFYYSSFFDMLEANIPREIHERMLLEKTVFGREAMNVIACEAAERIERPESYKQWQVRNTRAGFEQLPLDKEIMEKANNRVKTSYHKEFVIDEDGQWMLQGWKGRILYALSSWRPA
ncbi:hypothetical protein ACJIZ3_022996 [Penstemon smallii]|uniref:Uncharacterized protein n=1 Tax=Penstemon smallii TaxID=265156 RepID=A0ABD3TQ59_9LAMI